MSSRLMDDKSAARIAKTYGPNVRYFHLTSIALYPLIVNDIAWIR